jgi:hypothetical protein
MARPHVIEPVVGDWFLSRGQLFEVVAVDDAIEIQYHDGSVEEMDFDDWALRCKAGALETADPPEDYSGANDVQAEDEPDVSSATIEAQNALHANGLEDLDLFE